MLKYFIVVGILFGCDSRSENNSPCELQATYDSGPSSSFNFRKDGTFEWTNGSGLGVFQSEGSDVFEEVNF